MKDYAPNVHVYAVIERRNVEPPLCFGAVYLIMVLEL